MCRRIVSTVRFCLGMGSVALCLGPISLAWLVGKREQWGGPIMVAWCRCFLWMMGARVTRDGLHNVPSDQGFVLVSNHESHLEGPMLVGYIPRYVYVVAKKELFDMPLVGHAFRAMGFISVNRKLSSDARRGVDEGAQMLTEGGVALVFPEGTRSKTGELAEFKRGAVIMAIQAGVPLLPVGVAGCREVFPPTDLLMFPGPIHFTVGAPISTAGLTMTDRGVLNDRVREAVLELKSEAHRSLAQRA
ncbi:MAG: 1-acyl-sn-glycerol-3-phosphate acyltransferase [Kiritimatiellia bacterium]